MNNRSKTVWALVIIMLSGIVVYYSWLKTVHRQLKDGKPPMLRPVDRFRSDGHKGQQVELFDSDNVMCLVGYFYAGDEAEALAVCRRIQAMRGNFPQEKKFRLIGFSMDPKLDSPEVLAEFAAKHGFTSEEWVFVSGDRDRVRNFMNKFFRYPGHKKPDKFRESLTDLYARELRVSLVHKGPNDEKAFIRGVYWEGIRKGEVRNDKTAETDIKFIIENEMEQNQIGKSE
ncbi:MAG: SCO family protein [Verrucomicrobiales bacterium]|nr:SCO family protein [Verrucomicrobiales bacterium]